MVLSREQENSYLAEFYPTLRAYAISFCCRFISFGKLDLDDCIQELSIVLLAHIRSIDSEENLFPLPFRDFRHALCLLVLNAMPCTVPKRTVGFKEKLAQYGFSDSVDDLFERGVDFGDSSHLKYDEIDERLSFQQFLGEINDMDAEYIRQMSNTGSMTDSASILGVNRSTVSRRLSSLKQKYLSDCA